MPHKDEPKKGQSRDDFVTQCIIEEMDSGLSREDAERICNEAFDKEGIPESRLNMKNPASNILGWICAHKWAITEDWLRTIVSIAKRENYSQKYEALLARGGEPLKNTRNVVIRGNVAIVPIIGPIFPRANMFTEISGAVSIEELSSDFTEVMDSPDIEHVILRFDSPGGEVTGVGEFADMIFQGREKKNIISFVEGGAHSAAFWLASQTMQIILAPAAMVGSIGTMVTFIDDSKSLAQEGIEEIEIVSNLSPNKNRSPKTKAGVENIIEILDALTEVFISAVARGRGVSSETVLNDFGQGKSFVGQAAIDLGMADTTGTLESLILKLTSNNIQTTGGPIMDLGTLTMAELKTGNPKLYNEIYDGAKNEGILLGKAEGLQLGTEVECKRIKDIEAFENSETKEIIAKYKFNSEKSSSEIAAIVLNAQAEKRKLNAQAIVDDGNELGAIADQINGNTPEGSGDKNANAVSNMVSGANKKRDRYMTEDDRANAQHRAHR